MTLLKTLGLRPKPAGSGTAAGQAARAGAPAGESPLDIRADVAAVLQQVLDLVLGGLNDDEARKAVNADYLKLKAAFDKAGKLGSPKSQLTAYRAILAPAQALRARADGIRFAFQTWDAKGKPLLAPARAALAGLPAAARTGLGGELDTLTADAARYARAADATALQSIVLPRLQKLHGLATMLPKRSAEIDAGIAAAAKVLLALDKAKASALLVRLAALQNAKKDGWPAGATLDELAASVDGLLAQAQALRDDGQSFAHEAETDRKLEHARYILGTFQPHLADANQSPVPSYIDVRQANVRRLAGVVEQQIASRHADAALKTLGDLGTAIGDMGAMKQRHADYRAKFEAARDGPVKLARELKLEPADFAASRDRQLQDRQDDIESSVLDGVFDPAMRMIGLWITESKAWVKAQAAYRNLHGKSPDVDVLADLAGMPGGDQVLDRLVADLPPATTPKVLITALKARYGVDVQQYKNLKHAPDKKDPTKTKPTWDIDEDTRLDPSKPDPKQEVDLEGLYKVLGKLPKKDVAYVEKIKRVTDDRLAALYSPGILNDTIELHCGRPGDNIDTELGRPGQVVPAGEKVDPGCEPADAAAKKTKYFDFTVLHEVGHAVDDARSIMSGGRGQDAGWHSPGTGTIAEKIAAKTGYAKGYIEDMLDDKDSKPPATPPSPPKGVSAADWDKARLAAEAWVQDIRVGKELWDDAATSKLRAVDGIVYHEAYDGQWVGYKYAARAQGITGYQFRAPAEWFAELYAAYHSGKLNPKHPATAWLAKLKAESLTS